MGAFSSYLRGDGAQVSDEYHDDPIEIFTHKRKKTSAIAALITILVTGGFFLQSTLAANVTVNSARGIEFGQGISRTVACSGATVLKLTPEASFVNESAGGVHYFKSVTLSNIPSGCIGVDFIINAYGNSDPAPLPLFNTSKTEAIVNFTGATSASNFGTTIAGGSDSFTVTFSDPVARAGTVFKITLQSGGHTVWYNIGMTGPGGGTIFYIDDSQNGFDEVGSSCSPNCHYLEAAPTTGVAAWSAGADQWGGVLGGAADSWPLNTLTNIGSGYSNTLAAIAQNQVTAFLAVVTTQAYRGPNNLSDWFIPSRDELNEAWKQRAKIGMVLNSLYWSSSEVNGYPGYSSRRIWSQYFNDAGTTRTDKYREHYAYYFPVRAF